MFGDEDKENSTAPSWDYEAETEPTNTGLLNATNEKDLFDVINDSLKYSDVVDTSKQPPEKQTNISNQILQSVLSEKVPSYNTSGDDDGDNNDEDDDEEEISLLDFFLKGDSALSPTTAKPFVFNITGKPLLNGMTNSPMQIQPILPDNMKNESLKFSMLPMSLYNMVKDDGSLMFEDEKNQTRNVTAHPLIVPELKHANKEIQSELSTQKSEIASVSRITSDSIKTTTHIPTKQSTVKSTIKKFENNHMNVRKKSNQTNINTNKNKTESENVKNSVNETESTTQKVIELSPKKGVNNSTKSKITSTTLAKTVSSTTEKTMKTTPITTTTIAAAPSTSTPATIATTATPTKRVKEPLKQTTNAPRIVLSTARSTVKIASTESTITTFGTSTRTTIDHPKITAVQINSNPSILETDISYDYSEATLPPSLPNLKIIPFLPTDALKNIIHKNDGFKSNYNYYQSSPNSYANHQETFVEHSASSPFNIKPNGEKHPTYGENVADDRIDYDSYKIPSHGVDSLDYVNVYATSGDNMIQPASFQMSVNSKLDYGNPDQKVVNVRVPGTVNRNLTVKPPLPPFEPEHEYDLYNLPAQPHQNQHQHQLQVGNTYNEYSVNGAVANEPYSPEHNYNVPHFVTMPPLKEPLPRPISNKDSIFSYGHKNKFIPPAKTEGKFMLKMHLPNSKLIIFLNLNF